MGSTSLSTLGRVPVGPGLAVGEDTLEEFLADIRSHFEVHAAALFGRKASVGAAPAPGASSQVAGVVPNSACSACIACTSKNENGCIAGIACTEKKTYPSLSLAAADATEEPPDGMALVSHCRVLVSHCRVLVPHCRALKAREQGLLTAFLCQLTAVWQRLKLPPSALLGVENGMGYRFEP